MAYKYSYKEEISDSRGLFNVADNGITQPISTKMKLDTFKVEIRCSFLHKED